MNKKLLLFFTYFFTAPLMAQTLDDLKNNPDFRTTEEILDQIHNEKPTDCASQIFSNALYEHRDEIDENDPEFKVRAWAHETMTGDAETLKALLQCPEIQNIADTTTVIFSPLVYEFPNGRTITINYSTQPKVLKQKLMLAYKRSLPDGNASPNLMDNSDGSKYLNTEPAWYAIMVVQHDSLKDFVGPDKNNTLSIKYIDEHIDEIYPHGYYCTSKSALANDHDTINQVVKEVVNVEDDSNDYYVAGDVNLEWIMYAEIAADVLLTVATVGIGEAALIGLKGARATKTGIRLAKNTNKLRKFKNVEKYIQTTRKAEILQEYQKTLRNLEKAKKAGKDISKYEKELEEAAKTLKRIDPDLPEAVLKNSDDITKELKNLEKEIKTLTDVSDQLKEKKKLMEAARKKADPLSVKDFDSKLKELDSLRDLQKTENELKNIKNVEKRSAAIEKNNQIKQRIAELEKTIKDYDGASTLGDYPKLKREVDELESVQKYMEQSEQLTTILKYRNNLRAFQRPQTGNIVVRNLKKVGAYAKAIKASQTGAKTMTKAGKIARAGMSSRSTKINHRLMDAGLKHGARLARFERDAGLLYGAISFMGDMYDKTSSTSKEFSNGIEFKPLCLLSADDLKGQENVVNYGMWLMWVGNSTDPADDDAAYLQAMDFASKFYYQLDEFQDANGANCNVDIYVVRPIIRLDETNIDNPSGELFYLFMNEIPWSTSEQFNAKIGNIEDWERTQSELHQRDPENKYNRSKDDNTEQITEQVAAQEIEQQTLDNATE